LHVGVPRPVSRRRWLSSFASPTWLSDRTLATYIHTPTHSDGAVPIDLIRLALGTSLVTNMARRGHVSAPLSGRQVARSSSPFAASSGSSGGADRAPNKDGPRPCCVRAMTTLVHHSRVERLGACSVLLFGAKVAVFSTPFRPGSNVQRKATAYGGTRESTHSSSQAGGAYVNVGSLRFEHKIFVASYIKYGVISFFKDTSRKMYQSHKRRG
jgi:hypothetical protein